MSQLVKTYYDISKLTIWAEPSGDTDGENKRARMIISFRDGNPRITVYTGVSGGAGVISFPSDCATMASIMQLTKDVIAGQPGIKYSIDSLTTVYENNKPTSEKKVLATFYVGKSKEGLVYFSVISEGKPKLVFTIKPSPFHVFRDAEKNVVPDNLISCRMATGIVEMVMDILSTIITSYTAEEYTGTRKPVQIKGRDGSGNAIATSEPTLAIQDIDDLGL